MCSAAVASPSVIIKVHLHQVMQDTKIQREGVSALRPGLPVVCVGGWRHEVKATSIRAAPELPERVEDVVRLQRQVLQSWPFVLLQESLHHQHTLLPREVKADLQCYRDPAIVI